LLREIQIDRLVGNVRVLPGKGSGGKLDWRQLARLIPSDFRVERADLDIATATTMLSFGELQLSASAVESGKFFARRLSISSPILRQTFSDLRGATSWEGDRLTIAGVALIPGLDLEALTLDLSRLKKRRLGIDLHLDAYGGTLRASFQGRAGEKFSLRCRRLGGQRLARSVVPGDRFSRADRWFRPRLEIYFPRESR
jgi:hypothetical protein